MRLVWVLIAGWITGCAIQIHRPELPPPPSSTAGAGLEVILPAALTDLRKELLCGTAGARGIECAEPPAQWIVTLLGKHLERAGVVVLPAGTIGHPRALRLEGQLLELFSQGVPDVATVTTKADVRIALLEPDGSPGGQEPHELSATGKVESVLQNWRWNYQQAVDQAVAKLLAQATERIIARMRR